MPYSNGAVPVVLYLVTFSWVKHDQVVFSMTSHVPILMMLRKFWLFRVLYFFDRRTLRLLIHRSFLPLLTFPSHSQLAKTTQPPFPLSQSYSSIQHYQQNHLCLPRAKWHTQTAQHLLLNLHSPSFVSMKTLHQEHFLESSGSERRLSVSRKMGKWKT